MRPMLATPVGPGGAPPSGPQWSHEVKWDGMRVLADVRDGQVRLFSRNETEATIAFPEVVTAPPDLADAMLDGEVVAMVDGRPSFAALAERMHVRDRRRAAALAEQAPVSYLLFDVGPTTATVNGWIYRGRLIPLAPSDGSNLVNETW